MKRTGQTSCNESSSRLMKAKKRHNVLRHTEEERDRKKRSRKQEAIATLKSNTQRDKEIERKDARNNRDPALRHMEGERDRKTRSKKPF